MGVSTNAVLFYGFDLGEGDPWPDMDDFDWEGRYLERTGGAPIRPTGEYPKREDQGTEAEARRAEWGAYFNAKKARLDESGCKVDTHCSGEYPMFYVAIAASEHVAHRGDAKEVVTLEAQKDWDAKLAAFCEVMGIMPDANRQPRWLLVSYWG